MTEFECHCGFRPDADQGWRFCPECGSRLGNAIPRSDVCFELTEGRAKTCHFELVNHGPAPITYHLSLYGPQGQLAEQIAIRGPADGTLLGQDSLMIPIAVEAGWANTAWASDGWVMLRISSNDAPRHDHWVLPERRQQNVRISIRRTGPGRLEVRPELLIFSQQGQKRSVTLRNVGGQSLSVYALRPPAGYRLTGGLAELAQGETNLAPDESLAGEVVLDQPLGTPPCFEWSLSTVQGANYPMTFLNTVQYGPTFTPSYVVGVDFGTTNSAILVRRLGRNGQPDEYRWPPGEEKLFPSMMYWTGQDWLCGELAQTAYVKSRDKSRLVEGIKQWLGAGGEILPDWPGHVSLDDLLRSYLQFLKSQVAATIEHSWGDDLEEVRIFYVFSVPVLDGTGERHEEQQRRLERIARQVFLPPDRQDQATDQWAAFPSEPVCAALYLLMAHQAQIEDGGIYAVFDSGGGTTDLALVRVRIDGNREIRLEVLATTGLTGEAASYGGNAVTDDLLEVLDQTRQLHARVLSAQPEVEPRSLRADLKQRTDSDKITLCRGETPPELGLVPLQWDDVPEESRWARMADLTAAVELRINAVFEPIESAIFTAHEDDVGWPSRQEIHRIFLVGGNSLVPRLQLAVGKFFQATSDGRLCGLDGEENIKQIRLPGEVPPPPGLLDEEAALLAVVQGTARVFGAQLTEGAPYRLILEVRTQREPEWLPLMDLPPNSTPGARREVFELVGLGDSLQVRLRVEAPPSEGIVAVDEIVSTHAEPTDGELRIIPTGKGLLGCYRLGPETEGDLFYYEF